jgi:hypothetical protein
MLSIIPLSFESGPGRNDNSSSEVLHNFPLHLNENLARISLGDKKENHMPVQMVRRPRTNFADFNARVICIKLDHAQAKQYIAWNTRFEMRQALEVLRC